MLFEKRNNYESETSKNINILNENVSNGKISNEKILLLNFLPVEMDIKHENWRSGYNIFSGFKTIFKVKFLYSSETKDKLAIIPLIPFLRLTLITRNTVEFSYQ